MNTAKIHSENSNKIIMTDLRGQSKQSGNMAANDQYDAQNNVEDGYGCCGVILIGVAYIIWFFTLPLSLFVSIKVVKEYERAVIMRMGRMLKGGAKGPGLFFILPCTDEFKLVDLRTVTFNVPQQEILTKDSVTVSVDAACYYKIVNPVSSVLNVADAQFSTRLLAATTLRNILGTRTLQEILQDKEVLAHMMTEQLDNTSETWGIKVERVELKDVKLPLQMQRAMAAEAESTREARAKVIAAEGEQKASVALAAAANVINQSPVALQLRYLQTLTTISAEKNSTIIFPIPIEMLKQFSKS